MCKKVTSFLGGIAGIRRVLAEGEASKRLPVIAAWNLGLSEEEAAASGLAIEPVVEYGSDQNPNHFPDCYISVKRVAEVLGLHRSGPCR